MSTESISARAASPPAADKLSGDPPSQTSISIASSSSGSKMSPESTSTKGISPPATCSPESAEDLPEIQGVRESNETEADHERTSSWAAAFGSFLRRSSWTVKPRYKRPMHSLANKEDANDCPETIPLLSHADVVDLHRHATELSELSEHPALVAPAAYLAKALGVLEDGDSSARSLGELKQRPPWPELPPTPS